MLPFLSVFLILNVLLHTLALPNGAPPSTCDTLLPLHGQGNLIEPLRSLSPFKISPQATAVAQGQILRIQIDASPPELTFGGFMLLARSTSPPYRVVGRFAPSADGTVKLMQCGGIDNAVTHTSTSPKRGFGFDWQAPADFVGEVIFNGTIAQEYDRFWVGLQSTPVQVLPKGQVPPSVGISTQRPPLFSSTSHYEPSAQAQTPTPRDPIYEGCGDTKSCFGFPNSCIETQDCKAIASTTVRGDKYIFEIKSGPGITPAYIALGFSHDNKMGQDSVIECVPENGVVNIYHSWTTAAPYTALRTEVSQRVMRLLDASHVDGVIQCRFERDAVSSVQNTQFDLINQQMHLLLAVGSGLKPGKGVGFHDIGKDSTAEPRFLAEVGNFGASSKLYLRLHGAFMIIAWIGCTSVGILLARYFKQTWVGKSACGKDVWFTCHRTLMVLTWLLTVAAFVLIFLDLGGWSQAPNPHAILGTITTVLCFIQPIGALFRPHPGHKNRPLFNWCHWLGGNLAHILAIVSIFFAVKLSKAELPEWMDFILVAYVAFHVFIHFIFSIAGCVSDKKHVQRVTSFPMTDISPSRNSMMNDRKQDAPYSGFKKLLLGIYIFVIILFVVALVVIVVLAPIESTVDNLKAKIMN